MASRHTSTHRIVCWQFTRRCSRQCDFCVSHSSPHERDPTRDAGAFVRRLWALGTQKISFSGGEALLDPAFEAAVDEGRRLNLDMILTTNGDPLRRGVPESLRLLQYVKLSFYGVARTHDMAMNLGNYRYLMRLCSRLRSLGIQVGANYMLTERSRHELRPFLSDAARAGMHNVLLQTYMPIGDRSIDERWRLPRSSAWTLEIEDLASDRVDSFPGGIKIHDCGVLDFFVVMNPLGRLTLPRYAGVLPFDMGSLFDDHLTLPDGRKLPASDAIESIWCARKSTEAIMPLGVRAACQNPLS